MIQNRGYERWLVKELGLIQKCGESSASPKNNWAFHFTCQKVKHIKNSPESVRTRRQPKTLSVMGKKILGARHGVQRGKTLRIKH